MSGDKVKKNQLNYWYKITINECPVCGSQDTYRERQYDLPKPENPYEFEFIYDNCDYY